MVKVTQADLNALREKGLIGQDEIAYIDSGTIIAESMLTSARRIVDVSKTSGLVLESSRQILKG